VIVRAVSANGRAHEEMMLIRSNLQNLLGEGMRVTAEIAAEPLVRPGGKIPLIINIGTVGNAEARGDSGSETNSREPVDRNDSFDKENAMESANEMNRVPQ
jgi:hypothetical protein